MPSDEPAPPPHVMSIYRLSMLTSQGASAHQIENQIGSMVAAWRTELAHDPTGLRDRLDELVATLRTGLEQVAGDAVERQTVAFHAALNAVARARADMG